MATTTNLPALQQRFGSMPATSLTTTQEMCRILASMSEQDAWALLQAVVKRATEAQLPYEDKRRAICSQLAVVASCRPWPQRGGELQQLRTRWGCPQSPTSSSSVMAPKMGAGSGSSSMPQPPNGGGNGPIPSNGRNGNGGCNCPPEKKDPTMYGNPNGCPVPTPQPIGTIVDWKSGCGGYRMPDPTNEGLHTQCDAAACVGGMRVGLERIPFNRLLAPGVLQTISLGFTRRSRLVALTFTRQQRPTATLQYNPDNIFVTNWRTSSVTQPYDLWRVSTTFGGIDPNTIPIPLTNYFEDGDDALSPILHAMNFIPTIVPPTEIGNNEGLVSFDITLDVAAPAAEQVFGWAWVLFLGQNGN